MGKVFRNYWVAYSNQVWIAGVVAFCWAPTLLSGAHHSLVQWAVSSLSTLFVLIVATAWDDKDASR
ncbi:hypothetical protein [Bradyrhizobium erythrophlei]|uniref:Uncharacterized protein n=1 Tax=Bradyrhizobium erythrophlei TaxID=1437360 RepID=A0A1M7T791_9BRAD|nr:hypothetical protein [Bradyrhizobium erythrophlei]SHN66502.1 hypothetical protein SAMN05444170_0962 [Bradyrhizobium erythrophlei]